MDHFHRERQREMEAARAREAVEAAQRAALGRCLLILIRRRQNAVRVHLIEQLGEDPTNLVLAIGAAQRIQTVARRWLEVVRDKINLTVVTQDGNEIFFKMKQSCPLGKLMNAFCNRQGVSMQSVRFLFDGQRLREQQTPAELDMEDGDVIDVMVEQMGD